MTSRCKRKSYDRTSLRRSIRLTQGNTLRRLGIIENDGKFDEDTIIGNDGKFDEDTIQDYADYLKELLPPDVLNSLMRTCFLDLVGRISLPSRYACLYS